MQQTETTTVQTGPTTAQTPEATVETGGTTVETATPVAPAAPVEPTTLHDFTLGLLTDLDAREAFLQDPLSCLEAAGLSDITAGDVHEILPLVLDAASVPNVEAVDQILGTDLPAVDSLLQIAGNVEGVTGVADVAAPSAITALVSDVPALGDFSGLGDVSGTLDSVVSTVPAVPAVPQATEVVSTVSSVAHGNVESVVGQAVEVAGAHGVSGALVQDIDTDVLVKDVVDTHVLVKDVVDTADVAHVTGNVVQDVAQVGDVHHDLGQVIGDVKLGDVDLLDGGIGNHNDVDLHL